MRTWLWIIGAAGLLVVPFAAQAADYGSSPPAPGSAPPVAQALVREGDFAIKLAAELDLGTPTNEASAEDMLVKAGVAPSNGWLSDYPMTPEITGQLQESISRAASQGTLTMTADQAVRGLYTLTAQFNLPTPAGQGPATSQNAPPAAPTYPSDQQVLNDYYYDAGPPIMTYYPPPPDYLYLYDWVPYPVWWFGFWFPGFYICQNFSTVVVFQSRPVVVSNHFIDRDTRTVVTVDPVGHRDPRERSGERPETVLRTEQGDRYRTVADLHQGSRMTGPAGGRRDREGEHRAPGPGRYRTAEAERSAASIYSRSTSRMPDNRTGDVRAESGAWMRDGRQNSIAMPSQGRGDVRRTWRVPSEQRTYSPALRGNDPVWDRQFTGTDRSGRGPFITSPEQQRGSFRSLNQNHGDEGYGNQGQRSSSGGQSWGRQDMNDMFSGSRSSGGFCRGGRC